jgi:beta-ureidopropionase / N-carbamoyl-L-amino-acid hydrolase
MKIDGDRPWRRVQLLAQVGAVPEGGIVRSAYSAAHAEAVALVAGWMRDAGLEPGLDDTANLIAILPGREPDLGAIGLGSHLDTVPHGGAFDGALGVLAALEVVQTLRELRVTPRRSLAVLAFADEEGNDLGIGVLSAQLWIGAIGGERLHEIRDGHGRSLADYLAAFEVEGVPRVGRPALAGYLELHVEQGPVLDRAGHVAAAVAGIVGISRTTVVFDGSANHAGTTPMDARRDALWGGAELALAVRELGVSSGGRAVTTIGVFEVQPGATNVIPGRVRMRVEMRSPDETLIGSCRARVEALAAEVAEKYDLAVAIDPWHHAPAVAMDTRALAATQRALREVGLEERTMASWAGHDAKVLARAMPVGMLFVPSKGGVSHAPGEETTAADCAAGAEALLHAAVRLAEDETI